MKQAGIPPTFDPKKKEEKQRQSRGQEKVSLKLFHALIKNGQTA
jgi:hypothetical protein